MASAIFLWISAVLYSRVSLRGLVRAMQPASWQRPGLLVERLLAVGGRSGWA